MAVLNIGFLDRLAVDSYGKPVQIAQMPPGDPAAMPPIDLDISAKNNSGPFPQRTRWLRLETDVRCRYWIAQADTADFPAGGAGFSLGAGAIEFVGLDQEIDPAELDLVVEQI